MSFDDFFDQNDFLIDPEEMENNSGETFDTGIAPDIFTSGQQPDIFNTKDVAVN